MTEEQDKRLNRLFFHARAELTSVEFTSSVMQRVRRHELRSAIVGTTAWLGVFVVGWFFSPFVQSGLLSLAAVPGEAALASAGELATLAQGPLIFMLGLVGVGYFLIDSVA